MRKLGGNLDVKSNRDSYAVAVAIALLIASVLLVTFYVIDMPSTDPYTTIYLLDSNGKAADYPEVLYAGVNSTFNVYVYVENHLGDTTNATVEVKVTNDSNPTFPSNVNATQTFTGTLKDGTIWKNVATVSLNKPGDYLVAFELWISNQETGTPEYSNNVVALNVHVA